MEEKIIGIRFTEKGKRLNESIKKSYNEWLELSEMTENDLLEYRSVKGFHINDEQDGVYLAYYEDGEEKQIGAGICRESIKAAQWIFGYVCALLDNGNDYKSEFSKEYLKWGARYEKR